MQDYLFECRYQMDDRLWDEILRYYYFRRPLSVAIFVFSGVFLLHHTTAQNYSEIGICFF